MNPNNGDIVLVGFPFTNLKQVKVRPALVISSDVVHKEEDDVTLLFISSVIPSDITKFELCFRKNHADFEKSGLKKDSLFKTNKIVTIQKKLIHRKLGTLGDTIRSELKKIFPIGIKI